VVQEVFLAAARSSFDPQRGTAWSYLAGIAHHQAATWWRQRSRQARLRELVESNGADLRRLLDSAEPIDELLVRRELIDVVRFVLADLSTDYAALLVAKYIDEQSLEQIATAFDTTEEAVKSKLARARREFRTRFEHASREPASTRES
jgi:RNA polymerase sigma-70 factor (ECF subfamily)